MRNETYEYNENECVVGGVGMVGGGRVGGVVGGGRGEERVTQTLNLDHQDNNEVCMYSKLQLYRCLYEIPQSPQSSLSIIAVLMLIKNCFIGSVMQFECKRTSCSLSTQLGTMLVNSAC